MTVKAEWFFDTETAAPVEEMGTPIDLNDHPQLNQRLVTLLQAEGRLDATGVTCEIKDRADTACSACPLRGTDDAASIKALCAVGVEQEQVLTRLAVARAA